MHNMGIARFLATSRRLHALKTSSGGPSAGGALRPTHAHAHAHIPLKPPARGGAEWF